jgi:hypothetical protein
MNSRVIQTRRVHYFSGFDPRGASYYHRLCEEELMKPQVKGGFLTLGHRQRTGKLFSQWTVKWSADDSSNTNEVQTEHIFISWYDIIRENWSRESPRVLRRLIGASCSRLSCHGSSKSLWASFTPVFCLELIV